MQSNFNLKEYNTLQVNCVSKLYTEIESIYWLLQLLETKEWQENTHWVLGWGANTLFTSDFFDWIVIKMSILWINILKETDENIIIQVWAWENWDNFVKYCVRNQLWGIENLISIPWCVWASAVWNIWAYWQEAWNCIKEIIWVNLETKTIQKIKKSECNFWYRDSIFKNELKGKFIITHIVFSLKKISTSYEFTTSYKDVEEYFYNHSIDFNNLPLDQKIGTISSVIAEIRDNKLPDYHKMWTAGSYFKNPEIPPSQREKLHIKFPELKAHTTKGGTMKLSAWQLIELCWWKWKAINKVKMYEKHALILVNEWSSWEAVVEYANTVKKSVQEKFWVCLVPEVIYAE